MLPEEIEDLINQLPNVVESLIVGRQHALVALVVVDKDALKAAGITDKNKIHETINSSVLALNSKLPAYSQIGRCEIRTEPFEKTPKLSIKRFMYN